MLRFYNTLGRKIEDFKPLKDGEVKLYTCGPTVYDFQQIGNFRTFVFDDTLRRALEVSDYKVRHVMNITDVGHLVSDADEGEDKLEKGARREGKTVWEVADSYIKSFLKDVKALNILEPNAYQGGKLKYARATDFIKEQLEIIKVLLDKGLAYQTEQAIYFDVAKFPTYGELTAQKLSDKEVGARADVVTDSAKRNPQDFAVWFFLNGRFKDHEMQWDSPWGKGFPGWHLECSAIIHTTLGDPIDIHTGGVDNIGTHHVNEMAQSEAAFGHKLANYWVHGEHLMVDGQRMGKSLGNFHTLDDVIKKGFDPLALRLLYLQAHYRSQTNFTWDSLASAQSFLERLRAWADLVFQPKLGHKPKAGDSYPEAWQKIKKMVADDLNTPEALAVVAGLIDESEKAGVDSEKLKVLLAEIDKLFGLKLTERQDISEELQALLGERETARQKNDFTTSDKIRDKLAKAGLEINDTPHGQVWSRKN